VNAIRDSVTLNAAAALTAYDAAMGKPVEDLVEAIAGLVVAELFELAAAADGALELVAGAAVVEEHRGQCAALREKVGIDAQLARQRGAPPPGATDILGLEACGHVAACGPGVESFGIGDRVCALTNGGSYADYVIADAELVLPVPEGLEDGAAAALPEALFTAWLNLVEICGLKAGEVVLIHGGASGVGAIAIQLARLLGARVFATAGSEDKCAFACQQGAESCFNYRSQDFVDGLRQCFGQVRDDQRFHVQAGLHRQLARIVNRAGNRARRARHLRRW
jgi:Zn-dependent alcohol dehydrogenase